MLLPWAPRQERRDAIVAAEQEKRRSQASAAKAAAVERDLRSLAAENHWAAAIARTLRNGEGA